MPRTRIKTFMDTYVTALDGGGAFYAPGFALLASHIQDNRWDLFQIETFDDDKVAFKTITGHYLTAINGGGMPGSPKEAFATDSTEMGALAKFTLEPEP